MLLDHLLESFWDNYRHCKLGCPQAGVHTAYSQSTHAVLPACFWSELCQLGRLVTTTWSLLPFLQLPWKHQVQLTPQDGHACWRICFEQATVNHLGFCYSLVNVSFIQFNITQFMCRKYKSSQNFKTNVLVGIIRSLNADYMTNTKLSYEAPIPCPTLLVPSLTDN